MAVAFQLVWIAVLVIGLISGNTAIVGATIVVAALSIGLYAVRREFIPHLKVFIFKRFGHVVEAPALLDSVFIYDIKGVMAEYCILPRLNDWMSENMTGRYDIIPCPDLYELRYSDLNPVRFWFWNSSDAVLFKLRWC